MSLKLILVEGGAGSPDAVGVVATIVLQPATTTKCRAGGRIYVDGDTVIATNITVPSAGATIPDPGPYVVAWIASATKTRAEGSTVVRVDDKTGVVNATPQIPGTPPVDYPVSFFIKATNAGQTKVRAQ